MMKYTLLLLIALVFMRSDCAADIYVNGLNVGESYTLSRNVRTVEVDGGILTLGRNAGIHKSLQLSDGLIVVNEQSSGNLNGVINISGGAFLGQGQGVSYTSGFQASGGIIRMEQASTIKKSIFLSGDAQLFVSEHVGAIKGTIYVEDDAEAFFGPGFTTDSNVNGSGKVIGSDRRISGRLKLKGHDSNFSVSESGSLYVGVIPEPAVAGLIVFAGIGTLAVRRLFCA